jgi:hypothetical protein
VVEVDDFDPAIARAVEMKAEVVTPRHRIAIPRPATSFPTIGNAGSAIRTGYTVVPASPDGSAG